MCVIMIVDKEDRRPTSYMIDKAWTKNDDWGGVAWREPAQDGKGKEVCWKKGIETVDEMHDLIGKLPIPFIAHFRVASCGGVRRSLTHPFPIEKNAPLHLEGRTKGQVLFHNGDWKAWAECAREAAIRSNTHIPTGHWSDTRAIAWLCSIYGPGFMEFLPEQKGVIFGTTGMDVFTGASGWIKVNEIWCSNDYFMSSKVVVAGDTSNYCKFGTCTRKDLTGGYCPMHPGGVLKPITTHLTANHVAKPESGGTSIPFLPLPPGGLIPLEVAETLHKTKDRQGNRMLSKQLLKKIRNLYSEMAMESVKRKERARKELVTVSHSLTTSGQGTSTLSH